MSAWSYIYGTIAVSSPGRSQAEVEYVINSILAHLPRVEGSEGDMNVSALKRDGYNVTKYSDEYFNRSNLGERIYGHRNGKFFTSKLTKFKIQNEYFIVVDGRLRDVYYEEAYKMFIKWLCRLSKRLSVDSILVSISGETYSFTSRKTIISDASKYRKMFEHPSWNWDNDRDNPKAWWEHLLWWAREDDDDGDDD